VEKQLEAIRCSRSFIDPDKPAPRIDWLDRLTLSALNNAPKDAEWALKAGIPNKSSSASDFAIPSDTQTIRQYAFLVVEWPNTAYPIIHEESATGAHVVTPYCPTVAHDILYGPGGCMIENERGIYEFSLQDRIFSGAN
jgi:hypothetical protein